MRRNIGLTAAVICVLAAQVLIAAGCGGGEQSSSPEKLTKAQFLKAGNHVCKQAATDKEEMQAEKVEALLARTDNSPSQAEIANLAAELLPPYKKAVIQLAALADRVGDAKLDKLISEYELAVDTSERNPGLLARNDPFIAPSEGAKKYGLTACVF